MISFCFRGQGEELGEVLVARPQLLLADHADVKYKLAFLSHYRLDPAEYPPPLTPPCSLEHLYILASNV